MLFSQLKDEIASPSIHASPPLPAPSHDIELTFCPFFFLHLHLALAFILFLLENHLTIREHMHTF